MTFSQSNANFDHLVIFVKDSTLEKQLQEFFVIGSKLSTKHVYQGTSSNFFIFYNTFIELMYLDNEDSAKANRERFGSDYLDLWQGSNQIIPYAFGYTLSDFENPDLDLLLKKYVSKDQTSGEGYWMSQYNMNFFQPILYFSSKNHEYHQIKEPEDFDKFISNEEVLKDFKNYVVHPSGVKNLTKIKLSVPKSLQIENFAFVAKSDIIALDDNGSETFSLELIFDNGAQGQSIVNDDYNLNIVY